jgi:rod shape-determining protein MreB and related proteins
MLSMFKQTIYIQLSPQLLTLRNPKTGQVIAQEPLLAIERDAKGHARVAAVGAAARLAAQGAGAEVVNPFNHPRSLVSDFTVGEQVLKHFVRQMIGTGLLAVSPQIVLHPMIDPEGGFTQVELRALSEMALGAGASKVLLWLGAPLSDQDLLSGDFSAQRGQLVE